MMKSITDKIALQHLINAYLQETGQGFFIEPNQQTQDFYDLLCKKVDKVGVSHTESHSVHH